MSEHNVPTFIVPPNTTPIPSVPRKPFPKCCKEMEEVGGVYWEETASAPGVHPPHVAGWVFTMGVSIAMRSFWLSNARFCPYCGAKLPEQP